MDEGHTRLQPPPRRSRSALLERPDRVAMWAFVLAVVVMIAAAASAHGSSGGVTSGGSGGTGSGGGTAVATSRYSQLWESFSTADRRWARRTSRCESGGDPMAIGGGGKYRGAFQFTLPSWHRAPKSPGGDPIDYAWQTQAVVAVLLKHHVGTAPWPQCG
jgi:Transglycosylase-like domain